MKPAAMKPLCDADRHDWQSFSCSTTLVLRARVFRCSICDSEKLELVWRGPMPFDLRDVPGPGDDRPHRG